MAITKESMEIGKNHLEILRTLYGMIMSGRRNEMGNVGNYVSNLVRNPLLGQYPYTMKSFEKSHIEDITSVYDRLLEQVYSTRESDANTILRLMGNVELEMGHARVSAKDLPSLELPRTSTLEEELGFYSKPSDVPESEREFFREEY